MEDHTFVGYVNRGTDPVMYGVLTSAGSQNKNYKGYFLSHSSKNLMATIKSNLVLNAIPYQREKLQHALLQPDNTLGTMATRFYSGKFYACIGRNIREKQEIDLEDRSLLFIGYSPRDKKLISAFGIQTAYSFTGPQICRVLRTMLKDCPQLQIKDLLVYDSYNNEYWRLAGL